MYPQIDINVKNIIENAKVAKKLCKDNGISLSVVTKVLSGNKEVLKALIDAGIDSICESRIENLISYKDFNVEKWLIRIPMQAEIPSVIKYADISLNSELDTIIKLDEEAGKQGKKHKIVIMYELGDLREGCMYEELEKVVEESLKLKNIIVYGIGVNLSCYGSILPSDQNMKELEDVVLKLQDKFNYKFKVVSGGNSTSYKMLQEGRIPKTINHLRLGESIFFGNIPCYDEPISNMYQYNFVLKAQIVELKRKPSVPWGDSSELNSNGDKIEYIDKGMRKRAIVAIGRQDVRVEQIVPKDSKVEILDGSSDHLILDVTESSIPYKVGDIVEFRLNYSSVLSLMTSNYVKRNNIK